MAQNYQSDDPQDSTSWDCPNPPHRLEDFVDLVASTFRRDPTMGDEADIQDIEQYGLYGLRLTMASGQIFLVRIGIEGAEKAIMPVDREVLP